MADMTARTTEALYARKAVVVFATVALALTVASGLVSSRQKQKPDYVCAHHVSRTSAVISGEDDGDTADVIAIRHCTGNVLAAAKKLRARYGIERIMHGAIVRLP